MPLPEQVDQLKALLRTAPKPSAIGERYVAAVLETATTFGLTPYRHIDTEDAIRIFQLVYVALGADEELITKIKL